MDTKKVIEINHSIREARKRELEHLKEINNYSREVMEECNHEVVVRMWYGMKSKVLVDCYYCPACDMFLRTAGDHSLNPIRDSKIIDLTDIPIYSGEGMLDIIKNEIINNYDKYKTECDYDYLRSLVSKDKPAQMVLK